MDLAIIGGGPAGLRAAEVAALGGARVTLYEGKASVGRKFLIAGKGGLNLTHSEPLEKFSLRYSGSFLETQPEDFWTSLLADFDNCALCQWAAELGIETFVGTSGRIFPKEFKAAPLLRRWVERLRRNDIQFKVHHLLSGISRRDGRFTLEFSHYDTFERVQTDAVILALGGASWPQTGSDGKWTSLLKALNIDILPLSPANCGWEINWHPDILTEAEGHPLKNITVTAGGKTISGELLITQYGFEGGAIYQLGKQLRSMKNPTLTLDLKPSFSAEELANKIHKASGDLLTQAIIAWRLSNAPAALLRHLSPPADYQTPLTLAQFAKALPISINGPRPIDEAISSAGGVGFSGLDENLMARNYPGLFLAGEMLDWEAPTGGYLLQGCFATGTRAARGALQYLSAIPTL